MAAYSYIYNEFPFIAKKFNQKVNDYLIKNDIKINIENKIYETLKKDSHWVEKKIGEIINKIKSNDHLIIYNLTHMARSAFQVYQIFARLQQKNITLHIIENNIIIKLADTIETKKILYLCEIAEESFIVRRTSDALLRRDHNLSKNIKTNINQKIDKHEKAALDKNKDDIMKYLNLKISKIAIAKLVSCKTSSLNSWISTKKLPESVT